MNRSTLGSAVRLLVIAALALSTAACSDDPRPAADGPVTITVNGLPPGTEAVDRKKFLDDLAEFEKANPTIKVDAREGYMDPKTFTTKLAGGQLEDLFYVYFTDPGTLIGKRQVAEITPYLNEIPAASQIRPELMKVFSSADGKVYGIPWRNYSMGLLFNRNLFVRAGLDPNNPPRTWAEVRTAAQKITALGDGIVGYGDYSKSNTGGWHFTAELYSLGGEVAIRAGETWKAAFNDDKGRQVLRQLHDMRWTDKTMGERQLLEYADLIQMMAAGKLGMYIATGDNLKTIVNQYKGNYTAYGLGPMPGGQGTLAGGDGFMFKAGTPPEKIRAGLKWLAFKFNNPDRIAHDYEYDAANSNPVGLPEPNIWTGAAAKAREEASAKHANVPVENFKPFAEGNAGIPLKLEPPNAQQIYAVLDTAMQKVLTDQGADIDALLADAEIQVNSILAAAT
ncbi:MAG TPA: extracellular solute-binding protein [Actinophytocola sp.]|uniref:ABC transporter substrate-binding protein n=1 Tax=Actinophytocola sp. TaxID=1872138 RepID=UPI002DDCE84D|nr:extracellular solute-binding protein [Actinophytocola sp.]HEV2781049.1 extracellular solute-binding protein [Actinophytocola sp.]